MKTYNHRQAGFTLVEIMIVVAIIGLLAAIAIPNFTKARSTAQTNVCLNNLRQIDSAKEQWALETKAVASATPTESEVAAYVKRGMPTCPVGTRSYVINALGTSPACQNFVDRIATNHVLQ